MSFLGNLFHHPNSPEDIAKRNADRDAKNAAQPPHINSPEAIAARQASIGRAPILSDKEKEDNLNKLVDVIGRELSERNSELNKTIGTLHKVMVPAAPPQMSSSKSGGGQGLSNQ